MATEKTAKTGGSRGRSKEKTSLFTWPYARRDLLLFLVGTIVILLGYIFLGIGPHDSFVSLTIAPILLIIGYLVILPLALVRWNPFHSRQRRS